MFAAAVHQLLESCDEKTLVPLEQTDDATCVELLQIFTAKRGRWFWQSAEVELSGFRLNDILLEPHLEDLKPEVSTLVKDFKSNTKFDIKGSIGASLFSLFSVKISAGDSTTVQADLGDILLNRLNLDILENVAKLNKINMEHALVKDSKGKCTLCVITELVALKEDKTVKVVLNRTASGTESTKMSPDLSGGESLDDTLATSMVLSAGTSLACRIHPLTIDSQGRFYVDTNILHPSYRNVAPGFIESKATDNKSSEYGDHTGVLLKELITIRSFRMSPDAAYVVRILIQLMDKIDVVRSLQYVVKQLVGYADYGGVPATLCMSSFKKILGGLPAEVKSLLTDLIRKIGYEEDAAGSCSLNWKMCRTGALDSTGLSGLLVTLEALYELSDVLLLGLHQCLAVEINTKDVRTMFYVLYNLYRGVPLLGLDCENITTFSDNYAKFAAKLQLKGSLEQKLQQLSHQHELEPIILLLYALTPEVEIYF